MIIFNPMLPAQVAATQLAHKRRREREAGHGHLIDRSQNAAKRVGILRRVLCALIARSTTDAED